MAVNRIDPTPVRISTNMDVARQTPKTDFGDKVNAGLNTAATAVANGAAVAAPFVPGGAIVSAAVSSVTQLSNSGSAGAVGSSAMYSQSSTSLNGAIPVGSGGGINTTVGAGGAPGVVAAPGATGPGGINYAPTAGGGEIGQLQSALVGQMQDNAQMMQVQMQMQHENQVFSTVSNVLKVRHDTVKNTIQNVH